MVPGVSILGLTEIVRRIALDAVFPCCISGIEIYWTRGSFGMKGNALLVHVLLMI